MTDDQTLSDHDYYKAMHDAFYQNGKATHNMGSRKIAQSPNSHWVGGGAATNIPLRDMFLLCAIGYLATPGKHPLPEPVDLYSHDSDTVSFDPFSQAAKSIACGHLSASEQDFHERLVAQLQKDADQIRKTCAIVRDPTAPRVVEYKKGEELWATIRGICCG